MIDIFETQTPQRTCPGWRWPCLWFWFGCLTALPAQDVLLKSAQTDAAQYQKIEFTVQFSANITNVFDPQEIALWGEFVSSLGQTNKVPGFWHQPYERQRVTVADQSRDWFYPSNKGEWQIRFAPSQPGLYSAQARIKTRTGEWRSPSVSFRCTNSISKGYIRVSKKDPRFLEFISGQPFFAIGQNLAFIGSQQYVTLSKAEQILSKLASNGANYVRVWSCCEDWAMAVEARKSAFGRSWDWHPPLEPIPGQEQSSRRYLALAGKSKALRIDPSHQLAVKPGARYRFLGEAHSASNSSLTLELNGKSVALTLANSAHDGWHRFEHAFQTGPQQHWLGPLALGTQSEDTVLVNNLSLREEGSGPELLWEADVNRPVRGYYNQLDSFMLDEVVEACEKRGVYLQLCLLTRDLYMNALKDPQSQEYQRAIHDACRTFRYAIARWGYSTAIAAWEYWNEMDPGLPTDKFYSELGKYLEETDPYHHLRTTSTWGPSAKDCRHPELDIADMHFYLRPSDKSKLEDEVDAVLAKRAWLREQFQGRPAHLGEFGIANEKWQPREETKNSTETCDLHNALWASALSGTCGTAMFWWWERLDQWNFYPDYKVLSEFLQNVPWNSGRIRDLQVTSNQPRFRVVGLRCDDAAWLWVFDRKASWGNIVVEKLAPNAVPPAMLTFNGFPAGSYEVQWSDTRSGHLLRKATAKADVNGNLEVQAPAFQRDLALELHAVTKRTNR